MVGWTYPFIFLILFFSDFLYEGNSLNIVKTPDETNGTRIIHNPKIKNTNIQI